MRGRLWEILQVVQILMLTASLFVYFQMLQANQFDFNSMWRIGVLQWELPCRGNIVPHRAPSISIEPISKRGTIDRRKPSV